MISATEVGLRAKKPPEIIGWAYVKTPGVQLRRKHKESARPLLKLRRGAVLPVFRIHAKKGPRWFAAVGVNLGDATPLSRLDLRRSGGIAGARCQPRETGQSSRKWVGRFLKTGFPPRRKWRGCFGRAGGPGRIWSSPWPRSGFPPRCPGYSSKWRGNTCLRPRRDNSHPLTFPPRGAQESNPWKCST